MQLLSTWCFLPRRPGLSRRGGPTRRNCSAEMSDSSMSSRSNVRVSERLRKPAQVEYGSLGAGTASAERTMLGGTHFCRDQSESWHNCVEILRGSSLTVGPSHVANGAGEYHPGSCMSTNPSSESVHTPTCNDWRQRSEVVLAMYRPTARAIEYACGNLKGNTVYQ